MSTRYELRAGKYGPYFWDTSGAGYALPLESVLEKLNRKEDYKARLAKENAGRSINNTI